MEGERISGRWGLTNWFGIWVSAFACEENGKDARWRGDGVWKERL